MGIHLTIEKSLFNKCFEMTRLPVLCIFYCDRRQFYFQIGLRYFFRIPLLQTNKKIQNLKSVTYFERLSKQKSGRALHMQYLGFQLI